MGVKAGSKYTRRGVMAADTSAQDGERSTDSSEADLARDWMTIWQSELTAIALDPETLRSWRSAIQTWSGFATWILQVMPKVSPKPTDDAESAHTRAESQAWAASSPAASDPRDDEIIRLSQHITQLERRMADLERRLDDRASVDSKRRRSRNV